MPVATMLECEVHQPFHLALGEVAPLDCQVYDAWRAFLGCRFHADKPCLRATYCLADAHFLHSRKGRSGCMERIAIAMQDGGAGAGARHEGAERAARLTYFCLAAGPPGRGDFLVSNADQAGDIYFTRRRLNKDFLAALHAEFLENGETILRRAGQENPATFLKCLVHLVPKELQVEPAGSIISKLSDEQLAAMVAELDKQIQGLAIANGEKCQGNQCAGGACSDCIGGRRSLSQIQPQKLAQGVVVCARVRQQAAGRAESAKGDSAGAAERNRERK